MNVKRYNYPAQFPGDEGIAQLSQTLSELLLRGEYVLSRHVTEFQASFADFLGCKHVIGVNSGTDALLLTLMGLGIGTGDEVITQANTFHATVSAIIQCGARPVLVDVTDCSFQIDVSKIEQAVTSRTKAILPVHLYGYPMAMREISTIATRHSLLVIEDAAQAHGAMTEGKRVGTLGIAGCFSFHPSKNLAAAGDAGAIATNDGKLAERLSELRSLGQASQNNHVRVGMNSKLDAIQAAVLSGKLPYLDEWNDARRKVAGQYRNQLSDLPLTFQSGTNLSDSVFHLFQIRTNKRDELLQHLRTNGVDAVVRYPQPIHRQPAFHSVGWQAGDFPVAEHLADELLCLPIRPDLTGEEINYVATQIQAFFGRVA